MAGVAPPQCVNIPHLGIILHKFFMRRPLDFNIYDSNIPDICTKKCTEDRYPISLSLEG